jgi:acyl-CoA thioester hydrolase
MDDLLADFPVSIEIPVQWGDQDAFRHVNNTVYLRWFESSRIAYTRKLGLWELLDTQGIGPILASTRCDYRRPLMFPDSVKVGSKIVKVGRTSLTLEHRVVGLAANAIAAEGMVVVVLYDYKKAEPCPIPAEIRRAIATIEGIEEMGKEVES